MKVGIITVYDSQNLGSFLQAFALHEFVRSNGDEPYMIQTRSERRARDVFLGCDISILKRNPRQFLRYMFNYVFRYNEIRDKKEKYELYRKEWKRLNVITVKQANSIQLDLLLLGSDEIWNVKVPVFTRGIMYGCGVKAGRKAAYAVSAGDADYSDFRRYQGLINYISELDYVFVRDDHTADLLAALGKHVDGKIFDPTLQVELSKLLSENQVKVPSEGYILIYSYYVPANLQECIKTFARERHLKTVAVSLFLDWCDEYINCSPMEIGDIFRNASYVYTTTFHGTILSLTFHTQCIIGREKQKVVQLLDDLGMSDLLIERDCTQEIFSDHASIKIDYDAFERKLKQIRENSNQIYNEVRRQLNG